MIYIWNVTLESLIEIILRVELNGLPTVKRAVILALACIIYECVFLYKIRWYRGELDTLRPI